jgi:hypothetical protein
MNEEEAVKVFDLVVKGKMLPATLDKLVPLSFIGSAAVKFYQAKVKLMDQLGMSEVQRKATLADGQDAGEMLLNIEARIGELISSTPRQYDTSDVGNKKVQPGVGASVPSFENTGESADRTGLSGSNRSAATRQSPLQSSRGDSPLFSDAEDYR